MSPVLAFIRFRTRINYMSPGKQKFLTQSLLIAALLFLPGAVAAKQYKGAEIYTLAPEGPYGKYVMRMRAAKGSGLISAFFLWKNGSETGAFPWEEVDIEIFGKDNAEIWQTNIITGMAPTTNMSEGEHEPGFSLGDEYHEFTVEWSPSSVVWLLDGNPVRTVNGDPADDLVSAAQLRFNVWASTSVEWVGPWDDDILPRYMYVDWVEYYPWLGAAFDDDYEWRDDFNTFNTSRWGKADWSFDGNRVDFIPENAYVYNGNLYLRVTDSSPDNDNDDDYDSGGEDSGGYSSGGGGCPWIALGALYLFFARRKSG
jgi:hypothetical protein